MTCEIDLSQLYSLLSSPTGDFVRADYGDPDGPPAGNEAIPSWSIRIYYNDTGYQFGWFCRAGSMRITSTFSQRGEAAFVIEDNDEDGQIVPFVPVFEQRIEIWNFNEDHLYFSGFVRDVDPQYVALRADGTEVASYTVVCTDLYHELERKPVREIYENRKLGFILKDVIARYTTLDASAIDTSLGFTVTS
jgi:hypothetical protein